MSVPIDGGDGQFMEVVKFIYSGNIDVNPKNFAYIRNCALYFESKDLINKTSQLIAKSLTTENVFDFIDRKQSIEANMFAIEFIALNLPLLFKSPSFRALPLDYYPCIFGHPSFDHNKINEQELYECIRDIVAINKGGYSLFAYVLFERLPVICMNDFFNVVPYEYVSGNLWFALKQRLYCKPIDQDIIDTQYQPQQNPQQFQQQNGYNYNNMMDPMLMQQPWMNQKPSFNQPPGFGQEMMGSGWGNQQQSQWGMPMQPQYIGQQQGYSNSSPFGFSLGQPQTNQAPLQQQPQPEEIMQEQIFIPEPEVQIEQQQQEPVHQKTISQRSISSPAPSSVQKKPAMRGINQQPQQKSNSTKIFNPVRSPELQDQSISELFPRGDDKQEEEEEEDPTFANKESWPSLSAVKDEWPSLDAPQTKKPKSKTSQWVQPTKVTSTPVTNEKKGWFSATAEEAKPQAEEQLKEKKTIPQNALMIKPKVIQCQIGAEDRENLTGIFDYMFNVLGASPVKLGIITMDCGGTNQNSLLNLVDNRTTSYWTSSSNIVGQNTFEKQNKWFTITFPYHKVKVTSYTLCCYIQCTNSFSPKSWKFYGSDDGRTWTLISEEKLVKRMNTINPNVNFSVAKVNKRYYSSYKFECTANWSKNNPEKFFLSKLEFFGTIDYK